MPPPPHIDEAETDREIKMGLIMLNEVKNAIHELKNDKAPGGGWCMSRYVGSRGKKHLTYCSVSSKIYGIKRISQITGRKASSSSCL